MHSAARAFWLGAAVTAAVFLFTGASTFDLDASGDPQAIVVNGRIDQSALGRLLTPDLATLGTVRATKRSWGLVNTYSEQIYVAGARVAQQAGAPVNLRFNLQLPGSVTATNATARDGRLLVWTAIPADATLWAHSWAVNWPIVLLLAVAIALTFLTRPE